MLQAAKTGTPPARIEVFGFDVAEISQIRRISTMVSLGHQVHSFTMRRDNMNADFQPDWPNTHLFRTVNENLPRRALTVAASVVKMAGHRARLQAADMIVARNLDMLAIAHAARVLAGVASGPRAVPLVYECLDINGALCRDDGKSRAMRRAEKWLLDRCQMLVVSSPGFIRNYFGPMQGYQGPWALWENKLPAALPIPPRPTARAARADGAALRLGWVGTIRCAPSLALLAAVADLMGPRVSIEIHGVVHRHVLPDFDAVIAARPNMTFHGPYRYPDDLAQLYAGCELVWAQDLWQTGNNSDWLLPNRIYEASWAGCPSVAVAHTETGRRITADGLGWAIDRPEPEALVALLSQLDAGTIAARSAALLARPDTDFVQSPAEIQQVIDAVLARRAGAVSGTALLSSKQAE